MTGYAKQKMAGRHRVVILEGPNRAGKTTIAAELEKISPLGKHLKLKGNAKKTPKESVEAMLSHLESVQALEMDPQNKGFFELHTFIDRFQLFSDPIYYPLFNGGRQSVLKSHKYQTYKTLASLNAVVVYITAPVEIIEARFDAMEEHWHVGGKGRIHEINFAYDKQIEDNMKQAAWDGYNGPKFRHFINDGQRTPVEMAQAIQREIHQIYAFNGGFQK